MDYSMGENFLTHYGVCWFTSACNWPLLEYALDFVYNSTSDLFGIFFWGVLLWALLCSSQRMPGSGSCPVCCKNWTRIWTVNGEGVSCSGKGCTGMVASIKCGFVVFCSSCQSEGGQNDYKMHLHCSMCIRLRRGRL
jgi:hypothetical protein